MNQCRFALALAIVSAGTTALAGAQVDQTGPPAWQAFKAADAAIKDYTETITTHEIKDGKTEQRVYRFSFAKPNSARSEIVSGPGAGSVAVWNGGDTVRGHKGGFVSFVKLTLSIDDPRTTDLRGKRIDAAFFPTIISDFASVGKLTQEPGPVIDGVATDDVVVIPNDPSKVRGLTKDVFAISRTTHLPVEHLGYEGAQLVEDERFSDEKINPELPPGTFTL